MSVSRTRQVAGEVAGDARPLRGLVRAACLDLPLALSGSVWVLPEGRRQLQPRAQRPAAARQARPELVPVSGASPA